MGFDIYPYRWSARTDMIELCTATVYLVCTPSSFEHFHLESAWWLRALKLHQGSVDVCCLRSCFSQRSRIGISRTKVGMCIIYTSMYYNYSSRYSSCIVVISYVYIFIQPYETYISWKPEMETSSKPVACCCTVQSSRVTSAGWNIYLGKKHGTVFIAGQKTWRV